LDYKKLYHNIDGGYDVETLKSVLLSMKDDREKKGLSLESLYTERKNPLLHNETDKRLTEFIQERINKRLSKEKKEKAAAAKEAAAVEGAEEEKAEE